MRLLWLKFLRWFRFYNSGRRVVIVEGPGVVYFFPGTGSDVRDGEWVELGFVEDGWVFDE